MLIHKNRKKKKETLYNFCQFVFKKIEYRIKKQKQKHPIPEDLTYIFPL